MEPIAFSFEGWLLQRRPAMDVGAGLAKREPLNFSKLFSGLTLSGKKLALRNRNDSPRLRVSGRLQSIWARARARGGERIVSHNGFVCFGCQLVLNRRSDAKHDRTERAAHRQRLAI